MTTVLRIGLEMVVKCAKEPERVLEMMQEGSGVRLMIKHNGKTFKKVSYSDYPIVLGRLFKAGLALTLG